MKLQPGQAVVAIFRMRNLNSLSDSKQVCLVPNPNSQCSVILGRSFSLTRNGLCVSVLLNILDTTVSIQRGKKLGYALPMRTDYEETQNLKKHNVKDCPYHDNRDKILKRIIELKSFHKLFSMKSETDDGLSSCSNFSECPSSYELESDKPVLPEIEHLKGREISKNCGTFKIGTQMYFQNIRRISVAVISSNTKSNLKRAPFPIGKAQDE